MLYIATMAANEKITIKEQEYQAYDKATTYSEALLNNGMANYLEVLTARENALNAEMVLASTKLEKLQSVVTLYKSLGGGWR